MATTQILVRAGTTSAPQPVGPLISVAAAPTVLGGSVRVEFSPNGVTDWRAWSYGTSGTITQGGSFRSDVTGFVRCTATTQNAWLLLIDMSLANTPTVTQLACATVPMTVANATTEQVLFSLRLPPGFLTPTFAIDLEFFLSMTNNVNVKTLNIRWGGITGTVLFTAALASFLNYNGMAMIRGRGDGLAVIGDGQGAAGGLGGSAVAFPTVNRDYINQETELVFTITKATGTDVVLLESVLAKLF